MCLKTEQRAQQNLFARERFNIDQFKGYKADTILMAGSWNVEETALIANWGQEISRADPYD